jgi:hypothetical protein
MLHPKGGEVVAGDCISMSMGMHTEYLHLLSNCLRYCVHGYRLTVPIAGTANERCIRLHLALAYIYCGGLVS